MVCPNHPKLLLLLLLLQRMLAQLRSGCSMLLGMLWLNLSPKLIFLNCWSLIKSKLKKTIGFWHKILSLNIILPSLCAFKWKKEWKNKMMVINFLTQIEWSILLSLKYIVKLKKYSHLLKEPSLNAIVLFWVLFDI